MTEIDPYRASADALALVADAAATERAVVVNSPPGAGKSTLVREVGRRVGGVVGQVPIVVQTNEQADDMIDGLLAELDAGIGTGLSVGRLHRRGYRPPDRWRADSRVAVSSDISVLAGCDLVVAPAPKWAHVRGQAWPFAIVDEAYQMRSDALLPIGALAERLLLVGDPGQLAPFTTADARHLRGLAMSPLQTAAATVLLTQPDAVQVQLPVSWRLPVSAVDVIAPSFYDRPFVSGVDPGARSMTLPIGAVNTPAQAAVRRAAATGWAFVELPDIIMPAVDPGAVAVLTEILSELLASQINVRDERGERPLDPRRVAIGVTHRAQCDHVRMAVEEACAELDIAPASVAVDTANTLQGREFDVVIAWHPLSGRRDATTFHLDAGRLCVLLSRHRHACIVVSRGGLRSQLMAHPATEPMWIGEQIPTIDGWNAHLTLLDLLEQHRLTA